MKKCIVCGKKIQKKEDFCEDCKSFFEWKYGDNVDLRKIKEYFLENQKQLNSGGQNEK